jgi:hypothetical protein
MAVWDTTTPSGSDPANQGDDRIRELKTAIQDALRAGEADGDEALFPGPSPTTDPIFRHRGGYGAEASRPAASVGGQYFNTTTGTLQRSNGSSWVDLTENAAYEAIHQKVGASLASVTGVVTLPETGNSFNVSGTEAVTSIAGWSAGVVIVKWTQARTLTHGASFYLMEALSRAVSANDISVFEFTGSNAVREIMFHGAKLLPTRQTITSGSGTYNTPAGARQLRVRLIGGGGGGGGDNATGSSGGDTTFSTATAGGGAGGTYNSPGVGGAGGTASGGTLNVPGGEGGNSVNVSNGISTGGVGGASMMGAGGHARYNAGAVLAGSAGKNYGGGGSGMTGSTNANAGGGGGGGSYCEFIINNPASTYSYGVGASGAGGGATTAGGAGAAGIIIVDEIYGD